MDVMRLDSTTFLPQDLIEGYNSMIWTERFRLPGEFELKTHRVAERRADLPLGSLISLRDSSEVMIVEDHSIEPDSDGVPELKVTGRSLTSFIENRMVVHMTIGTVNTSPGETYRKRYRMKQQYSQAGAACVMLWNGLVSTITTDVTTPNAVALWPRLLADGTYAYDEHSAKDAIANTVVSDSTTKVGNMKTRFLISGPITEPVDRFLRNGNLGFRTIRPNSGPLTIVTVSSTGVITKTPATSTTKLRWDVYQGYKRTIDQTTYSPVVFRYDAGHLEEPKYLESIKGSRDLTLNDNSFNPNTSTLEDWTAVTARAGLARRFAYFDAGIYNPDEGMNQAEWAHHTQDLGEEWLRNRMRKIIFDGRISVDAPYVYKQDYFLGDTVTLQAEYGFVTPMQIIEYVRSEGRDGEVGYPSLNLPEPEESP